MPNRSSEDQYFIHLYDNTPSKWIGIIYSFFVAVIMLPVFYLLILYERDNHYRTLISQLVTTNVFCAIAYIILIQIPAIFLFIFGPFASIYCHIDILIRGTIICLLLVLINFVLVSRYILTFHFKNPTAAQHDFWALFISTWCFSFGLITQSVFLFLPGNHLDHYYVCYGLIPKEYSKQHKKKQLAMFYLVIVTIILHLVLSKNLAKFEKNINSIQPNSTIQKNMFLTYSSQLITVTWYLMCLSPTFIMASKPLYSFLNYPDYLWLYYFHFYAVQNFCVITVIALLVKNPAMFQFVKRELKSILLP
jgi:hypothetical protein